MVFARNIGSFDGMTVGGKPLQVLTGMRTSEEIATRYRVAFSALQIVWNQDNTNFIADVDSALTQLGIPLNGTAAERAAKLAEVAYLELRALAVGIVVDHDGNPATAEQKDFLTKPMMDQAAVVVAILRGVGYNLPAPTLAVPYDTAALPLGPVEAITRFQDIAEAGNVITSGLQLAQSNRSVQGLINNIYVRTGSRVIFEQMADLRDQQTITKDILTALSAIQDIHNNITVPTISAFKSQLLESIQVFHQGNTQQHLVTQVADVSSQFETSKDANSRAVKYSETWTAYADEHFKRTVDPVGDYNFLADGPTGETHLGAPPDGSSTLLSSYGPFGDPNIPIFNDMSALWDQMEVLIAQRNQLTAQRLAAVPPVTVVEEGSLEENLNKALDYFEQGVVGGPIRARDPEAYLEWLIDNLDEHDGSKATLSGKEQRALTGAINAGTNLNDEQKEELRRVLFIFEEYMKSASAVMQRVHDVIMKMAANIAR